MKLLTRTLLGLILFIVFLLLAVAVFVYTLNPNQIKPVLEEAANKQQLKLVLDGDITWQLYPQVNLSLGQFKLYDLASDELMLSSEKVSAGIQLSPLFQRKILVDSIELQGATLVYHLDKQGKSPWTEVAGQQSQRKESTVAPSSDEIKQASELPELAIESISILDTALDYKDASSEQDLKVHLQSLQIKNLSLSGQAFPLSLEVDAKINDIPKIKAKIASQIKLDLNGQTLSTTNTSLDLSVANKTLSSNFESESNWWKGFSSNGKFQLRKSDAKAFLQALNIELPQMQGKNALTNVAISLPYELSEDSLSLKEMKFNIDDFSLAGDVSVQNFDNPQISAQFRGDKLNLDNYLPPPTEPPEIEEVADPQPLPLELLRTLDASIALDIDKVLLKGLSLEQTKAEVNAKGGLIQLSELSTLLAGGQLKSEGRFDARGKQGKLNFNMESSGVDVGQVLSTIADLDILQGKANSKASLTSSGATDQELIQNLNLQANADSEGLHLSPVNIEQQFCTALAFLQKSQPLDHAWPKKTDFEPISIKLSMAEQRLSLDQMSTEIAHLLGTAQGSFDLITGKFNIPFSLSIDDFAGDIEGCLPIEEKWRKTKLPIRCKGSLDDIGVDTCLPDTRLLTSLMKARVTKAVQKEVEKKKDQTEAKLEKQAVELLERKLGEDSKKVEDTLRGFLKQRNSKKKKPSEK